MAVRERGPFQGALLMASGFGWEAADGKPPVPRPLPRPEPHGLLTTKTFDILVSTHLSSSKSHHDQLLKKET